MTAPYTRSQAVFATVLLALFMLIACGAAAFYTIHALHTTTEPPAPAAPAIHCPYTAAVVTISTDPLIHVCQDLTTGRDFTP